MRIKGDFAVDRTSGVSNYKKKYFIAYEGIATEPKYFDKLNESLIKESVTIINILRDYANQGHSNPTHIIKLLQTFLNNSNEEVTVDELKNRISNWNHENSGYIDLDNIFSKINNMFGSNDYKIKREELEYVFMSLFKDEVYEDVLKNFTKYFEAQDFTYSPLVDSLNMVIDRDKDSFTEEQYDKVVEFCKNNNINLYISNPCFELWLYMHFDEFDDEDKEELLLNKKINNSKKRYIEKRLNDICGYKKNHIKFESFKSGVFNAIKREKNLTEDVTRLKNELGTNVGLLVSNMIKEEN